MPDRHNREAPLTRARHPRPHRMAWLTVALVTLVVLSGVITVLLLPSASSWPARSGAAQETASGESRADPVPLGQEAVAGPLRVSVREVTSGPTAVDRVLAAADANVAPRDGHTYVLANVVVRNDGDEPIFVSNDDFGLTGSSGVIHRFLLIQPPEPALFATLDPGATAEGWLVFEAPLDETELLLVFDSLSLPGTWARRTLTLLAGSSIADAATPGAAPNEIGISPDTPAGLNTPIVSGTWQVELVDVAVGAEVFELVDYRTGALGVEDSNNDSPWLAIRVRVTNVGTGGVPAFFPPNAFGLADSTGVRLVDFVTLTPPVPDASGDYYPGASREGWVAFELPNYDPHLIVFAPFDATKTTPDPRYLAYE
jgi:hypothetical protein